MRWGQLTFTEGDIGKFDPDFWIDYFVKSYCDGVVLGSGGYMAFHPTEIPYHYKPERLHNDIFGYMVQELRKRNFALLGRTDGHAVHEDAFQSHPEWIFRDSNGNPRKHWSYPEVWVTCVLGDYGFGFMNEVHKELVSKYDLDGVFCNRWAGSGVCYCSNCQKKFFEWSGKEIPVDQSYDNPDFLQYMEWRENRLFELCETWNNTVDKAREGVAFIPNSTVGPSGELNSSRLGDYSSILFCDRQARQGLMPPWFNGRNGREMRAVMGNKPMGGIFSVGNEEKYRWKDSVQDPVELKLWVSEAVANGMRPWFTKFSAQIFDNRWMDPISQLYAKYKSWELWLRDTKSLAEVALLFSRDSFWKYGGEQREDLCESPLNGFYQLLLEERIPFDMFDAERLGRDSLSQYKTVILPNIAVLSDEQCQVLIDYVKNGGGLVATFESSLYDEKGRKRSQFGLENLFDVTPGKKGVIKDIKNAYIQVNSTVYQAYPEIHNHWKGNERLIGSVNRVDLKIPDKGFPETPFKAIAPYPDLPMEELYSRSDKSDYEEVFFREIGKGRVAYFSGDIDRSYWMFLTPDHGRLLSDSVSWTTRGHVLILEGPGFLDVTFQENDSAYIIHLVNMTSINALRGPAREIIPLTNLSLLIRHDILEKSESVGTYLEDGVTVKGERENEYIRFSVPSVTEHQVLVIKKIHL